ncbi:hypothetical protein DENSPDRAFT_510994 [Dentipellis sp. KUC8613]|nr:hypothetical protein DENSPDRAFT_510994 [Dentipellis sp. KUC8613]
MTHSSYVATTRSWNREFRGDSTNLLYQILKDYSGESHAYARFAVFLQSSGTGKSRQIDELSKHHVCIPINLKRHAHNDIPEQYPPPEAHQFIQWFMEPAAEASLQKRYHAFLLSLMGVMKGRLESLLKVDPESIEATETKNTGEASEVIHHRLSLLAGEFRRRMMNIIPGRQDLQFRSFKYGNYRQSFYAEVMEKANEIELAPSQYSLSAAAEALWTFLDPTKLCKGPLLVISFDEARTFMQPIEGWFCSRFSAIYIHIPYPLPFLPITEIGFDEFADRVADDGTWRLQRLASTYHIAHLGRALFPTHYDNRGDIIALARNKLLAARFVPMDWMRLNDDQELACLAVRLGLTFGVIGSANQRKDLMLVCRHMRLCLSASENLADVVTTAPSEPLLAEAAARCLNSWAAPAALWKHVDESCVSVGERGELIAALLVLCARDAAVVMGKTQFFRYSSLDSDDGATRVACVEDFLRELVNKDSRLLAAQYPTMHRNPEDRTRPLNEAFRDAAVWFNHFVKVDDVDLISQEFLWTFLARGAAVLCPHNQRSVDIVIPVLFHNALRRENVSAILIQVKNDSSFGDSPRKSLFSNMNPYDVGLFAGDIVKPLPVIRIVFALSSETPSVWFRENPVELMGEDEDGTADHVTPAFTAYDIWCAGVSDQTFKVVSPEQACWYQKLVWRSRNEFTTWDRRGSTAEKRKTVLRGMQPEGE